MHKILYMTGMSRKPLLEVRQVSKRFTQADVHAQGITDLSFDIPKGIILGVVGESGAGKSTLFRAIYGLENLDGGEILFQGKRVKGPAEQLIPGHPAMRFVTQHFDDLNQYAQVWDNVASRLSNTDLDYKMQQTQNTLENLKIAHLGARRVADLSGGERQRVAIARALVAKPEMLLMDEPFNQVDAYFRDALQNDLREIVESTGVTIGFISHDPAETIGLADHLIILRSGTLVQQGHPWEVYENPTDAYVAHLLARSNIVDKSKMPLLHIRSDAQRVAVHPEWITLKEHDGGDFVVTRVLYKGFYREVRIQHRQEEFPLRSYTFTSARWEVGMRLNVHVSKSANIY